MCIRDSYAPSSRVASAFRRTSSPHRSRGILRDERIGRDDGQAVDDGLADQHAVERVAVQARQLGDVQRRWFVDCQCRELISLPEQRQKPFESNRESQPPSSVFDGYFPGAGGADQELDVGAPDQRSDSFWQCRIVSALSLIHISEPTRLLS